MKRQMLDHRRFVPEFDLNNISFLSRNMFTTRMSPRLGRSPSYLGILVVSWHFNIHWLEFFLSLSELESETKILSGLNWYLLGDFQGHVQKPWTRTWIWKLRFGSSTKQLVTQTVYVQVYFQTMSECRKEKVVPWHISSSSSQFG